MNKIYNLTEQKISIKRIVNYVESGRIDFNNPIQRPSGVWNKNMESLLIETLICGGSIGNIIVSDKTDMMDVLDGKQRLTTIYKFINNEYELRNILPIQDGNTTINLNGLKFNEWPEEVQTELLNTQINFTIYYNLTRENQKRLFANCNNSVKVSGVIAARNASPSDLLLSRLEKHKLFDNLSAAKRKNSVDTAIIIRSMVLLYSKNYDMSTKNIEKILRNHVLSEMSVNELERIFDIILKIVSDLKKIQTTDPQKQILINTILNKRLFNPTHLLAVVAVVHEAIYQGRDIDIITDWILNFFDTKNATVSEIYNESFKMHTTSIPNTESRIKEVKRHFTDFANINYPRY